MDKINIDLSDYSDSTLFNLIEEVQKNEFLYDIPPSSRKNQELTNKREKTWNEIAWVFGLPANEVRSIWSKLRQGFVRHFKIYQSSKNTDKPFNPNNWKYFDSLLYLIPFLQLGPLAAPARPKNSTQIASQTAAKRAVKRSRNILLTQASTSDKAGRTQESQNLIEAVRNKPQLWELIGKSGALTREENEIRDSAFEEIAQELGSDAKTLKKSWWRLYYNYCTGKLSKDGELYNLMRVFDKTGIETEYSGNAEADASTSDDNLQFTRTPQQPQSSSVKQRPSSTVSRPSVSASPAAVKRKYTPAAASDSMRTNGVSHYSSLSSHADTDMDETASSISRRSGNIAAQNSSGSLSTTVTSPPNSDHQRFSEYYFGMCVAEMFEEVPKNKRARLKANIFAVLAKEFDTM